MSTQVIVVGPDGNEISVEVTPESTVASVSKTIHDTQKLDVLDTVNLGRGGSPLTGQGDVLISDLNLEPGETLSYTTTRRPLARQGWSLPRRTDIDMAEIKDPDNIESLVEQIAGLGLEGVTREHILEALRTAFFQVDRASEYLLAFTNQPPPVVGGVKLQPSQIEDVKTLVRETGLDRGEVIQVYFAVEKDIEKARELLAHGFA
jgi:hypothetical protein